MHRIEYYNIRVQHPKHGLSICKWKHLLNNHDAEQVCLNFFQVVHLHINVPRWNVVLQCNISSYTSLPLLSKVYLEKESNDEAQKDE